MGVAGGRGESEVGFNIYLWGICIQRRPAQLHISLVLSGPYIMIVSRPRWLS